MNTEEVNTVKKQVFGELSELNNFVTGPNKSAALSFRNYKIIDITTLLSGVYKAVARAKGFCKSKFDVFGRFNDEIYIADWWGPKKDVVDRLNNVKYEVQKQNGYL